MQEYFDKAIELAKLGVKNLFIIKWERSKKMLGEKILKLRKQKGFSQEQLGEQINVTRQTISNWELNETSPNIEQLKLLSKVLNISIDDLIGNEIKSKSELNNNIERINNKENKFAIFILFLDILISIIWGIAAVTCITENMPIMAMVNLALCIIWGLITVIWHLRKIK